MVGANKSLDYFLFWRTIRTIMENLLLIIKKVPLVTWKAFLVLWALFLGFMGLMIKFGGPVVVAMAREAGTEEEYKRSSDDDFYASTPVVDKVRTYQNGVDGAKRTGTTFYH